MRLTISRSFRCAPGHRLSETATGLPASNRSMTSPPISADAEGNVAYCGYTTPATDDMRSSFEQAFPG